MAMHQGFDLSRFKKVSSDAKSTTMRHANGHEVKIVHSALSPKMREQIEALPMHEQAPMLKMARGGKVKKMAEGGDPADAQAMDPTSPAQVPDDSDSAPDGSPVAQGSEQPTDPATGQKVFDAGDVGPSSVSSEPSDPNTIDVVGVRQPKPAPTLPQLQQDNAAWQQDLQNGHVAPETYQSLFAKKDTLGKIGTLFGLVVGGAGAGLTHQPNAALEMMNRTIQNDLDAQKSSKGNAVNYYNAAVNMMQGTSNAENVASHTALNNMRVAAYQQLFNNVQKMPPGPYQQHGMQMLKQMFPAIQAANAQNNAHAVIAAHTGGEPAFDGPVNNNAITALKMVAPELGGPAAQEADRVFNTRMQFDNFRHAFPQLDTLTAGQNGEAIAGAASILGKISSAVLPEEGMAAGLLGSGGPGADLAHKVQQLRNAQRAALGPDFPEDLLPSLYDAGNAKLRAEKTNRAAAWFKAKEGNTPMLDTLQRRGTNVVRPQPYDSYSTGYSAKTRAEEAKDAKSPGRGASIPQFQKEGK